jgi:hypothetical protein
MRRKEYLALPVVESASDMDGATLRKHLNKMHGDRDGHGFFIIPEGPCSNFSSRIGRHQDYHLEGNENRGLVMNHRHPDGAEYYGDPKV